MVARSPRPPAAPTTALGKAAERYLTFLKAEQNKSIILKVFFLK
jgi:predicted phage-related endonuclease